MINPAHVDLFRAVMRHGGMTRAASALGIGQPYVSRAIAHLESEIGFPLFVRGHGSALPTQEGKAFLREVERTYAGLDHLRLAARQIRELGTGPLRIACQPSLASRLVPRAIRHFIAEHPGSQITVHVPDPDIIWSWAASGQCDIGLVRPRSGYSGVISEVLLKIDAVCAIPKKHILARKQFINLKDLEGEPLVAGAPGSFQSSIERMFEIENIEPKYMIMAQYTAARCGLVAEEVGIAIVDPLPAREFSHLPIVLRPLRPSLAIETMLVRPAGLPGSHLAQRLIDILKIEVSALALI